MKRYGQKGLLLTAFLVVLTLLIASARAGAAEVILSDDFDSYNPGDWPTDWVLKHYGSGTQDQYVTDEESVSPSNSLTLLGTSYNSAGAEHTFTDPPSRIVVELEAMVGEGEYYHPSHTSVDWALRNFNEQTNGLCYARIQFFEDSVCLNASGFAGQKLMDAWERNRWYNIVLDYDAVAKTASVWIDGVQLADQVSLPVGTLGYKSLVIGSAHAAVRDYYDDVVVRDLDDGEFEDVKMHYPQWPDEAGWDVDATWILTLADDWQCTETGPVENIYFWGSWENGVTGEIESFIVQIYSDIPADPPATPYSHPGELLRQWEIPFAEVEVVTFISPELEGWFYPGEGWFLPDDHFEYSLYRLYFDSTVWFRQTMDTIYWLAITAQVGSGALSHWGWKSSTEHWNDNAVWGDPTGSGWLPMTEPPDFDSALDLSFVITGECCRGSVGNVDCDINQFVDIGDLTVLIDHLFINLKPLCCVPEADVDLSGAPDPEPTDVDMGDLTVLIDHLFISLNPLPSCP